LVFRVGWGLGIFPGHPELDSGSRLLYYLNNYCSCCLTLFFMKKNLIGGTGLQYGTGGDTGWGRDADMRRTTDITTGALCDVEERDCE
jgi:hypothetical protein